MKVDLSLFTRLRRLKAQQKSAQKHAGEKPPDEPPWSERIRTGQPDGSPPSVNAEGERPPTTGTTTAAAGTDGTADTAGTTTAPESFAHTGDTTHAAPTGWQRLTPYVYYRSFSEANPYSEIEATPLFHREKFRTCPRLCFYDTETTGLSGGAGNVAFLVGLGWITGRSLRLEQYFLADFPGEAEFLGLLSPKLEPGQTYVSYNGSAFDRYVLQTRFIMNGLQQELPRQLDLLFPARRLWKGIIGSCSLHNIEEHVLHIKREVDVPGFEVPALYFDYLRSGDPLPLEPVFEHNRQDVLSLIHLYFKLQTIFTLPDEARNLDRTALGSVLLEQGNPKAPEVLRRAFNAGDTHCGIVLSLHYKKQERWPEAVEIWQVLHTQYKSLFAGLELAKYREHKVREYPEALRITQELLSRVLPVDRLTRQELLHRMRRLQRKITGRGKQ